VSRVRPAAVAALAVLALASTGTPAAPPSAPVPVGTPAPKVAPSPAVAGQPQTIQWEDLVPPEARASYRAGPPPAIHDYLSGEGGLAAQQPQDFAVNRALDGHTVRMPGFIVPLELDADGKVTEFFLVPYFGACIHVPPPAPNQMLYVTLARGVTLDSMYTAYWVTGRLSAARRDTKLGAAAYQLAATGLEEYRY
jgi:hypothetical protein